MYHLKYLSSETVHRFSNLIHILKIQQKEGKCETIENIVVLVLHGKLLLAVGAAKVSYMGRVKRTLYQTQTVPAGTAVNPSLEKAAA